MEESKSKSFASVHKNNVLLRSKWFLNDMYYYNIKVIHLFNTLLCPLLKYSTRHVHTAIHLHVSNTLRKKILLFCSSVHRLSISEARKNDWIACVTALSIVYYRFTSCPRSHMRYIRNLSPPKWLLLRRAICPQNFNYELSFRYTSPLFQ